MAGEHRYLTKEEIDSITQNINNFFAEDTKGMVNNFNLKNFNERLKELGKNIEENRVIFYTNGKRELDTLRQRYTTISEGKKTRALSFGGQIYLRQKQKDNFIYNKKLLDTSLAEAYVLIMKFRELLFNERIDYGIYTGRKEGKLKYLHLGEEGLLHLMSFNNKSSMIEITTSLKHVEEAKKKMNKTYNELIEGTNAIIDFIEYKTNFINEFLPYILEKDFENKNKNFNYNSLKVWHKVLDDTGIPLEYRYHLLAKNSAPISDKKKRSRQSFNRGHLVEAIDKVSDQIVFSKNSFNTVKNFMDNDIRIEFYHFLERDSAKATRKGDNDINILYQKSIKALNANLYSTATIYGDIKELTDLIDDFFKGDTEKMKERLKDLFLISKTQYEQFLEDGIAEVVDERLEAAIKKINELNK